MKKFAGIILILSLLLGCATRFQTTKNTISSDSLLGEVYRLAPTNHIIGPLDNAYESFTYSEWKTWISTSSITFKTEAWDCDDYALDTMVSTKKLYRLLGKSESTPAIGFVVGKVGNNFLGLGSGLHALNIIHVRNQGWMFYEPQNGRTILVRDALRERMFTIQWVMF